jgi:hypothetical protein
MYYVEMHSGAMIYVPKRNKDWFRHLEANRRRYTYRHTDKVIS